jgi:hypothetical protein
MISRISPKSRHFTDLLHHDTKTVRSHAIRYGSFDEDTVSLTLAMIGLALTAAMVVSILIAFRVL